MNTAQTSFGDGTAEPVILIVDDRLLLRQVLTTDKYRIEEADDGPQALQHGPPVDAASMFIAPVAGARAS